jgi:type I restriction enzyme R subunit
MTTFSKEADFDRAVIHELTQRGWEAEILKPLK